MTKRVLVAGVGNVFLGDDGFGVEVVRRLGSLAWPAGVDVVDFGIRSLDLAYALSDGYDLVVLVDATRRGRAPGTLYVIEPEPSPPGLVEAHAMVPDTVLGLARGMVRVVGCEPASIPADDEIHVGLSEVVARSIEPAIELVSQLVEQAHA